MSQSPHRPKSESPDEFLKREKNKHYDGALTEADVKPSISKEGIEALEQPKETTKSDTCNNCE